MAHQTAGYTGAESVNLNALNSGAHKLRIGGYSSNDALYQIAINIYGVVVSDAVTSGERTTIETELAGLG